MKNSSYSILREGEYEKLRHLTIDGTILDIGGSTRSGYHELIQGNHNITTANIDAKYGCDLVFDVQNKFPLENETYNAVIGLNLLEHIYKFHNVFSETARVLKKDGVVVFSIPFLFHIHGSPDDYFRYTKSALTKLLTDAGFVDIEISEIGDGVFSLVFQTIGGVIPSHIARTAGKRVSLFLDRFLCRISKRYKKLGERIPLGYFVVARKP